MQACKSFGTWPTHVAVDPALNMVYTANYLGGSWTAYQTDPESGAIRGDTAQTFKMGFNTNVVPSR